MEKYFGRTTKDRSHRKNHNLRLIELVFNKYLTVVICFSNFCDGSKIVQYFQEMVEPLVGQFGRTFW